MSNPANLPPGPPDSECSTPLEYAIARCDGEILTMVRRAIERKEVLLAFQPIVQSTRPERPAFYEGLIRLLDETGRIIPARDFIEQAETTELGRRIDCLALKLGLRALAEDPNLRLAINMSARSISYPDWMRVLNTGLSCDNTAAERLILEITESSAMEMPDMVVTFMAELQNRGLSFALDDFGAGYTSFRYLREFYFDILKIDGQFIRGISDNPDNQVLTAALMSIAQHFDMFTVAESVESASDAAYLTELGIDCMQGYYFGAPTVLPPWKLAEAARSLRA